MLWPGDRVGEASASRYARFWGGASPPIERRRRRRFSLHPTLTLHTPPFYKQFVADGVFYAELNELLTRELAEQVRE